jgi:phosphoribosylglycinamide formyltransferase 1
MNAHVYTGNVRFIDIIQRKCKVTLIFCEKSQVDSELIDYCHWNGIAIEIIDTERMTVDICFDDVDVAFSFGFGQIFSAEYIERYPMGIWNIHTGKLPKYRGRHPISHAFLNHDKDIGISIHQINEKIDQGNMIASASIIRSFTDTEESIIDKTLDLLQDSLLEVAFRNYVEGNTFQISKGSYLSNFLDGIVLEKTENHSCDFVYDAVRSQVNHGGVFLNGKYIFQAHYYSPIINYGESWEKVQCSDGFMMITSAKMSEIEL